ncbi:ABC transporter G member 23 [Sarracenia purpurea var. burkii]
MASSFQEPNIIDDTTVLFSSTGSIPESTSPFSSSSSCYSSSSHHSPPPSPQSKLTVTNLSYTLHPNWSISTIFSPPDQKPKPINILKSVSFVAKSSEILAIVGPSGTGKSSLLRIISGRVSEKDFDPKSLISVNGFAITSPTQLRKKCGFVAQEDDLLPLLTVKETLMFSAKFRLKGMSAGEREDRVENLIRELGLVQASDSFVGDDKESRGISGGERKRVSIGVDIIHDPPVLVLDEPTSGLDSTSALQVIQLLSSMAVSKQRTIVLSIHQPSYRILKHISSFLILYRGSVVHNGDLKSLEEAINCLGFKIPVQLNALEFSMEIISALEELNSKVYLKDYGMENQNPESCLICQEGIGGFREGEIAKNPHPEIGATTSFQTLFEIFVLCERFWKIIYRTKQLFLARTMQALVGGLGLASVYTKVKNDETGIANRFGLFAFSLSFLLSSTVEALPIYLQERRVLMKEASRGAYRISSYMIANTIVFLPFLFLVGILFSVPVYFLVGLNPSMAAFAFFVFTVWLIVLMASSLVLFLSAVSPDFISGNSLICAVLGAFFLFSGYFIPKESIPKYWIFMYYVSIYRYPLDSLLVNEYWSVRGKCFSREDDGLCLLRGSGLLKNRGLDEDTRWFNVGIMFGFFLFYRLLCWVILLRRVSKTTI